MKLPLLRHVILPTLIILLMFGFGYGGYRISERSGIQALTENGERQLELHARAVESEINRYTYLPSLLELESGVSDLLLRPSTERQRQVNHYLQGLNARSGSRVTYVLDLTGRVLATSNWKDADSYQGEDLSFRAYYQDAVVGKQGRFYGIGSTIGEPGYYLAHGLRHQGRIIGVGVVKIRLEALEARWQKARLEAFVTDENGIIILSSDPKRRLKAVYPLSDEKREALVRSLQYHWWTFTELNPVERLPLGPGVERITLQRSADAEQGETNTVSYLAQTRRLSDTPWDLTVLSPLDEVQRNAVSHGMLAAVLFAFIAFFMIAWNERRKVLATRLAAREALQAANNELERKIAERTADLVASNARLREEIHERRQTEHNLRRTQDELVQAGKLAVIGQMSTSIAHELNQPLAALRTLSGNTIRFLERGALDTATTNLHTINELVDRMGRITASLRAFARRSGDEGEAEVEQAIDAALFLLHPRFARTPVNLQRDCLNARLAIDQTRLEQILVNLMVNALDAMAEQHERQLWLAGEGERDRYRLIVQDNGPGIAPELRHHLFEPFFTTKPGEHGLGLGLTLSASLAAAAKGSLTVEHPAEGGTRFVLSLPVLAEDHT